jgi:hypothetical protein
MAIIITKGAFGRCADVGKYEGRGGLRGYSLEVDAVPRWSSRSKDARLGAKLGVCVVSNAESVTCQGWLAQEQTLWWRKCEPLWGLLMSSRNRESNDCVRIECDGSRISFESKISSEPLKTCKN